jgi:UDP-N-acetylglucosamine--N-acetylmuramyl-(pentapeptide) pyrophosphoryl-undecaprenol N-acetylglucosamine transferase
MRVIITAGGTGGHIMPAIAIAEALREKAKARILFVGTDRGMEERIARTYGIDFLPIRASGIKGKRVTELPKAFILNSLAFFSALTVARDYRPNWVIGTGGYVTGMVVLAGHLMGARCAIQEQNSIPGLTNRILSRFAQRVFLSFPDTLQVFPAEITIVSGNPLRTEFSRDEKQNGNALVIMGGSLGAHSINMAAVEALKLCRDDLKGIEIIHQTGASDISWVKDAYRETGIQGEAFAFINNMASILRRARLVVCRAGGITLSELSRFGIPAIMIPFPQAADNHQMFNALHVSSNGGGWIIPEESLTPWRLAAEIVSRLRNVEGLVKASDCMQALHLGDGAERIAEEILKCSGA